MLDNSTQINNSIPSNAGGGSSNSMLSYGGSGGSSSVSSSMSNISNSSATGQFYNYQNGTISNTSASNYIISSIDYAYSDDLKIKNISKLPPVIKEIIDPSKKINDILSELLIMYSFLFHKGILDEQEFKNEYTDFKNSIETVNKFLGNE